jgi:hypothetical protein
MPRSIHYILRTFRWIVLAMCGVVLVVSLIMWPRSYFYYDGLVGPNFWTEQVAATMGTGFFIDFDGLQRAESLQWQSFLRPKPMHNIGYHNVPYGWMQDGGRNVTLYVEWYFLPVLALVLYLFASGHLRTEKIRSLRFRIYDLLVGTTLLACSFAFVQFAYRRLGDGGTVIAIESSMFLSVAYITLRYAFGSTVASKWSALTVASCCLVGFFGLGMFFWHLTGVVEPLQM